MWLRADHRVRSAAVGKVRMSSLTKALIGSPTPSNGGFGSRRPKVSVASQLRNWRPMEQGPHLAIIVRPGAAAARTERSRSRCSRNAAGVEPPAYPHMRQRNPGVQRDVFPRFASLARSHPLALSRSAIPPSRLETMAVASPRWRRRGNGQRVHVPAIVDAELPAFYQCCWHVKRESRRDGAAVDSVMVASRKSEAHVHFTT